VGISDGGGIRLTSGSGLSAGVRAGESTGSVIPQGGPWAKTDAGPDGFPGLFLYFFFSFLLFLFSFLICFITFANLVQIASIQFLNVSKSQGNKLGQ
jgi:hypothetical protein